MWAIPPAGDASLDSQQDAGQQGSVGLGQDLGNRPLSAGFEGVQRRPEGVALARLQRLYLRAAHDGVYLTTLPSATTQRLVDVAQHISTIAAHLKMDHCAGFSRQKTLEFDESQAISDRKMRIQQIFHLVYEGELVPLLDALHYEGVLYTENIIMAELSAPTLRLFSQLMGPEASTSQCLRRLASNLIKLEKVEDPKLGSQRRDKVGVFKPMFEPNKEFKNFQIEYFEKDLIDRVNGYLPKESQVLTEVPTYFSDPRVTSEPGEPQLTLGILPE